MQSSKLKLFLNLIISGLLVAACGGSMDMSDGNGICTENFMTENNNLVRELQQMVSTAERHRRAGRIQDARTTLESAKEKCTSFHSSLKVGDSCTDDAGQVFSEERWKLNCDSIPGALSLL